MPADFFVDPAAARDAVDRRAPISDSLRRELDASLGQIIPEGKTAALIVVWDTDRVATVHAAAKFGDTWKLALEAGVPWTGGRPTGRIMVSGAW